jgi:hypothetical protein
MVAAMESYPNSMVETPENCWHYTRDLALDALRAALAQPDTEMPKTLFGPNLEEVLNAAGFFKRKPLTEEEVYALVDATLEHGRCALARALERAHGIE